MEEAYAEAYHPRSNHVVKICIPNNYEVTDFLDLPKLEITFVRLKGGLFAMDLTKLRWEIFHDKYRGN